MLVRNAYSCHILSEHRFSDANMEMLTVSSGNLAICVVYRPPHGNLGKFFESFEHELAFLSENVLTYIGGDFNIDMSARNPIQEEMLITLQSAGFRNIIHGPTRVTLGASSCLDLILTNDENKYQTGRIAIDISDHLPIAALIQKESRPQNKLKASRQLIPEKRLDQFKNRIGQVNWSSVFEKATSDDAYDEFLRLFLPVYHECFPTVAVVPPK